MIKNENDFIKLVVVGHVDHGKSTLIGRILLDANKVSRDRVGAVAKLCRKKGINFEPAFLLDGLEEEREQGITIDTTRVSFEYAARGFCIIDAPGHAEFLRNMTTAASNAELGLLLLDCQQGVRAQTLQHIRTLSMLGVRDIVCLINKMDKLAYDQTAFETVSDSISRMLERENLSCRAIIPISAYTGENVFEHSDNMRWYTGQPLMSLLCSLEKAQLDDPELSEPFRMLLQDVYHFAEERFYVGRIISGRVSAGAEILFSPSAKRAYIREIRQYPKISLDSAGRSESVALTLSEDLFLERGELVSLPCQAPEIETEFSSRIVWLGRESYDSGKDYILKIGTAECGCSFKIVDEFGQAEIRSLKNGDFAELKIKTEKPVAFDQDLGLSNFVICSEFESVAAGVVEKKVKPDRAQPRQSRRVCKESGFVGRSEFEARNGHKGAVIWLTGLSGAGKSTLARELERKLFDAGKQVIVLDGDKLRQGLCEDLEFSPAERSENVRRIAQLARLMLDTGSIVIVACISPYKRDRELARKIIGVSSFFEVFVFCPLEICSQRDPKGLYRTSKNGRLVGMSGVDASYQPPDTPDLLIDSSQITVAESRQSVIELLFNSGVIQSSTANGITVP